ncbi:MAG: SusE domain-containing protein [Chitinophagaceae bacterium]
MKLNKYLAGILATLLIFSYGCKKTEFDKSINGEALTDFRLSAPASNTNLALNPATPNDQVVISWTASKPGLNINPTYKWVIALKTGSIDAPIFEMPSDNGGAATKLTLTHLAIDQVLSSKGIPTNGTAELIWSVVADNGTTKARSSDVWSITIKRNNDGLTPFVLLGPSSSQNNLEINPTSTTDFIKFNWTRARPASANNPTQYKVVFSNEGAGFANPLFSVNADANGSDSTLNMSWKAISDSLSARGYTDFSSISKLEWTVVATSGGFSRQADYINKIYIVRLVRMYLVGNITGWDINNPIELVADKANGRLGKVFYTYVKVATNAQFLFIKERGNWGSKYGITGGSAPTYDIGYNTGGDFFINTPGIYRLTIDVGNQKAHIQSKQVGLVGAFQGWNPGAPVIGGYISRDKFIILQNISLSDEFKFHDGPVWDNSAPDKARWWGKGGSSGTLDTDGNGPNLNNETGTAGMVRCIWDATDPQRVKYNMTRGQLRIVGSVGVIGNWDPNNALDMNYMGNGVWQKSVTFSSAAEFKFVSASGWVFNYGDGGGTSITEGGGNYNRPAGTYNITVDEYNRTCTIL